MSIAYVQGVSVEVSQIYQYVLTTHTGTSSQMTSEVLRDEETQEHIISLHPFRGLGIPDDIARAAVFLASEDSSWITGVRI
jgi:NAD(P)-dependent dehydrogenase (short-subunit alcohol dehydrogenase family)